jgi:hypothetical protein
VTQGQENGDVEKDRSNNRTGDIRGGRRRAGSGFRSTVNFTG